MTGRTGRRGNNGEDGPENGPEMFAEELKAQREAAGLTQEQVANLMGYSTSVIAKLETCRTPPSPDHANRADVAFKTPGTFRRIQQRLWTLTFPEKFRPFAGYEAKATALRTYQHSLMPGLLQTAEYARAVLATRPNVSKEKIEELVALRLARQQILERDNPPLLWALIDEGALRRPAADAMVMHDQLVHLGETAGRPNVTVQVVPYSAGGHSGLLGAFIIADFAAGPSIVYQESPSDGQTSGDPEMVAQVALVFDTLRAEALPRGASRDLIVKVTEEQWT